MNVLLKSVLSQFGGIVLLSIDNLIQSAPTGGLATFLQTHPYTAYPIYSLGVGIIHNTISRYDTKALVNHLSQVPPVEILQLAPPGKLPNPLS